MSFLTLFASGVCCGATLAILLSRNLIYLVLSFLVLSLAIAGLILATGNEFLAFSQVFIYLGGIGLLLVFAIMLTPGLQNVPIISGLCPGQIAIATIFGGSMLLKAIIFLMLWSRAVPDALPQLFTNSGSAKAIGSWMEGGGLPWLLMAGVLLTAAVVGTVLVAGREQEGGSGDE